MRKGGMKEVGFAGSPFNILALDFQTNRCPSCERPKTTQRKVFLLHEYNNCLQTETGHHPRSDNREDGKKRLSIIPLFK